MSRSAKRAARAAASELRRARASAIWWEDMWTTVCPSITRSPSFTSTSRTVTLYSAAITAGCPRNQALGPQIDICAEEDIEHPDGEGDKRQKIGPFNQYAF